MKYVLFGVLCLLSFSAESSSLDPVYVNDSTDELIEGNHIEAFIDVNGNLSYEQVSQLTAFNKLTSQVPNFGISKAAFWLRFTLRNSTSKNAVFLKIPYALLDNVMLYYRSDSNQVIAKRMGDHFPIDERRFKHQSLIFQIPLQPGRSKTIYMRVKSKDQILVPIYAGTEENILHSTMRDDLIFGLYLGVILVMFFYNLFVYFSVRDRSYLYYVFYIASVGLAQFCLQGYGYRMLWGTDRFISDQSVYWSGALSGIATMVFLRVFLHTRVKVPLFDKVILGFIFVDTVSVLLALLRVYGISYILIDIVALIGSVSIWIVGLLLSLRGFRPARFFIVAWSFFLLSVILYVVKDFGVIPYNLFTSNILLIGSSIEVTLLSFALADRINIYKMEKEASQAEALRISKENEHLVREQNILLEAKVAERTLEMQKANQHLNIALQDLKATQSQLVEAEKMASLGQLTAGIAHEINNPINFVKSNVKPLQMDIYDLRELIRRYEEIDDSNVVEKLQEINELKEQIDLQYVNAEIEMLIKGIEDGASRTADIVQGLRTFSRLDESELKEANIHEGIESTLILIRNSIPAHINIIRDYGELPQIVCFPGKLNQVFMNLLTNAVQAILGKPEQGEESIVIKTYMKGDMAHISIADTGIGIPPEIKEKVFDPFFTTKNVGEGTGLGLSIVFSIIEKHKGKIEVHSEYTKGTEFIITLPLIKMQLS